MSSQRTIHRRFTEKIQQLAVDVFRSLKTITLTEEEFQDELGKLKDSLKTTLLMDPYRLIYSKMVSLLLSYYSVDEKLASPSTTKKLWAA